MIFYWMQDKCDQMTRLSMKFWAIQYGHIWHMLGTSTNKISPIAYNFEHPVAKYCQMLNKLSKSCQDF